MKKNEIRAIASEYEVQLFFLRSALVARYNGKETDLMKRGQAYSKSWEYWHATFQELTRPPLANYWTTPRQQQDKLRQKAYDVPTRCVTRGAQ